MISVTLELSGADTPDGADAAKPLAWPSNEPNIPVSRLSFILLFSLRRQST
ncbi:hypothetical protein HC231_12570 [Brenneria izadpanahii]|uniref:Uncharacterized protein n=1 Tax=Brenneria izadpanahii TaxID=2722756 RepID=A0ABX7UWV8_9GAMM|nr:hypothetical protein HC231_12570 [Brenneria izadpanahii]